MPNRILREGILSSDRIAKLSWAAEVFYRRLMSVVDDFGLFTADERIIRAHCYPLDLERVRSADIATWIRETEEAALVRTYTVKDKQYVQLLDFRQQVRANKSKWEHPPSSDVQPSSTCVANDKHPRSESESESESETNAKAVRAQDGLFVDLLPATFGPSTKKLWKTFAQMQLDAKRPYTPISVGLVIREFGERGEPATQEALEYAIKARAKTITWPRYTTAKANSRNGHDVPDAKDAP